MAAKGTLVTGDSVIELLSGNSLDYMLERVLEEVQEGFDVIATSPPYNLGIDYRSYDDSIPRYEYLEWTDRWLNLAKQVLSPGGSLFLNMGWKATDPHPADGVLEIARKHFTLQNRIVWVKSLALEVTTDEESVREALRIAMKNAGPGSPLLALKHLDLDVVVAAFAELEGEGRTRTFGHFKPLNSPRFVNQCHEVVLHLTKGGEVEVDKLAIGAPYEDKSNLKRGTRGKNGDLHCRGDVWWIPYETIKNRDEQRGGHRATYPVELVRRCYKLHGLSRIKRTFDPFAGIGTSAVAAAELGLSHVGIELDEEDVRTAIARVEEVANRKRTTQRTALEVMAEVEGA